MLSLQIQEIVKLENLGKTVEFANLEKNVKTTNLEKLLYQQIADSTYYFFQHFDQFAFFKFF